MCFPSPFVSSFNIVITVLIFVIFGVHDVITNRIGIVEDDIHDDVLVDVVDHAAFVLYPATVILRPGNPPIIIDRNNGNRVWVKVK